MHKRPSQKGFTLVEMLVSVALFLVVMMVSVGTLLSLADANRKAQTIKTVMDNLNFAMDSMARNLRTGYDYDCNAGGSLECPGGSTFIQFVNDDGCDVEYRYDTTDKTIEREMNGGDPGCSNDTGNPLTADRVDITDMKFWVSGQIAGDGEQPSVTIAIRGKTDIDPNLDTEFNIQTTVTQRLLDL